MTSCLLRFFATAGLAVAISGCATAPSTDTPEAGETSSGSNGRPATTESRDTRSEPVTATEAAAAARRSNSTAGSSATGSGTEMAKLVEQLNEAARELATLRTANAKLRAERESAPRTAPAATPASSRPDPVDERLAASLKSYSAFKQEMSSLLAEVERARKGTAELSSDLKAATEQVRQARAALTRVEEDLRVEKRLRLEAEANAGQLREQLRTIARAMADAGLSAEKLTSTAESGAPRSRTTTRPPSRYVAREGDTLMKIAERVYGDASKWRLIQDANRGRTGVDGKVEAGTELQIPGN